MTKQLSNTIYNYDSSRKIYAYVYFSVSGNIFSFYGETSTYGHTSVNASINDKNVTYYYVAIGWKLFDFDVNYFFVTGISRDNSGFAPSLASMSWSSGYRRFSIYIAGLTTDFSTAGYLCDYSEYNSWYEFGAKYVNKKLYWFGD